MESDQASLDTMSPLLAFFLRQETITKAQAMDIPGFAGCVRFITETVAGLPIKLYRRIDDGTEVVANDRRVALLNGDTGDILNGWQFKKAMAEDLLIDGGAYAYIKRLGNTVVSLHYVARRHIAFLPGADPIFKTCGITVNGARYFDFEFIKATRRTQDGVRGSGILQDHQLPLSVAYNILRYENTLIRTGGNKRGFLKSEKKLE
jgi:phage portal protein BeeE